MSAPRLSILVPTLDAEADLARLLPALRAQTLWGESEMRVVDSDSSDCTRQILRREGIPVTRIEKRDFRHGATRNLLAGQARGELCVFLTQDALPDGPEFLAELVKALEDPGIAGSTARVLPHAEDDPLTARTVLAAPEASEEAWTGQLDGDPRGWPGSAGARAELLRFNNVASCIRASALAEIPFPDVAFGEDVAWAARALTRGWRLAFAARAVVRHAHRYGPAQAFERYRIDAAFHRQVHGHRVRPSLASVVRGFVYEVRADLRFVGESGRGFHHLLRSPGLRGAQVLGQYFGSRGWSLGLRGRHATNELV
jgi:rhamnosyltransferase